MKIQNAAYICTIDNSNIERTEAIRKELTKIYGPLRLRGRHSNRKKVLGSKWRKWTQNDVPWRLAETVAIYMHDNNKNYPYRYDWKNQRKVEVKPKEQLYREYYEKNTGKEMVIKEIQRLPQF